MIAQAARPSFAGVYPISEAALLIRATAPDAPHLVGLSTRHLHRWVKDGLAGNYFGGRTGDRVALTFLDLVSLRMVAIFRSYGVQPREIKVAHDLIQESRGYSHPFAMQPVWLFGPDIFIKESGEAFAVSKNWQLALAFIVDWLIPTHSLLFDKNDQPTSWEPEPGIFLDPQISFGEPCIKGTRIPTETLWALHAAGDPIDRIAAAYNLPFDQVESAIAWEERLGAIAA